MGPTIETRSRDEWLAEVKRRGGRLRRRRQLTMAVVGGLAMMLPLGALTTLLGGDPDGDVSQLVAGPAPGGELAPDLSVDASGQPAGPDEPATTTTTAAVVVTVPSPLTPATIPRTDDPVVRATTTIAPAAASTALSAAPSTTVPPAVDDPPPAPCVASEVKLILSTERQTYGPGETVRGSAFLDKVSPGTCEMPDWGVRVLFVNGAGRQVGGDSEGDAAIPQSWSMNSSVDQAESWDQCRPDSCRRPVKQGRIFTYTFGWEARDCSLSPAGPLVPLPGTPCPPFPPGTYTVRAEWTGPMAGPPARTTFELGG